MKILINTEWFAAIQDLPKDKQVEVLEAIMDYPNRESDTNLWKKVIKPQLETGRIKYFNRINNLKQYRSTESDTESVTESDTETEININKYNINNNINNNNINNYSNSISNNNTTCVRACVSKLTSAQKKEKITAACKKIGRIVGKNQILVTKDFTLPENDYFNAYKKELPKETESVVCWIRKNKMDAILDYQWIGKQIQNFHKRKTGRVL